MKAFHGAIAAATTVADLVGVVWRAIGPSDLMEFVRFDVVEVLRKKRDGEGPNILRLVDERADGGHLPYDSMASLLAPYGSQTALVVAGDLDAKNERALEMAAR